LESASGKLPYKVFVGSGLMIWLNFAAVILISLRMASSSERRNLLISLSSSPQLVAFSYLVPYSVISLFFYLPILQFKLSQGEYVETLSLTLITLLLLFVCVPVFLSLALSLCVLSTLIRDLRFILPYFSQLLLFASPIFYEPRNPNTFLEEFWTQINFLSFLISYYRELITHPFLDFTQVIVLIFVCLVFLFINRFLSRFAFVIFMSMGKNSMPEIEE
jgi:lipopolysaccharide transport system permease protein